MPTSYHTYSTFIQVQVIYLSSSGLSRKHRGWKRYGIDLFTYSIDAMKPAKNIAMLPAYDFWGLWGSFTRPNRLPTMSATPERNSLLDSGLYLKKPKRGFAADQPPLLSHVVILGKQEAELIPSPAHKLQITAIEVGDVLQKTIVVKVIAQA